MRVNSQFLSKSLFLPTSSTMGFFPKGLLLLFFLALCVQCRSQKLQIELAPPRLYRTTFLNTSLTFEDIDEAGYMRRLPTRVIIYDWNKDQDKAEYIKLNKYMKSIGEFNRIFVDHSQVLSGDDQYLQINVARQGDALGRLLFHLHSLGFLVVDELVIIGVGIGAHLAGNAGRYLKALNIPLCVGTIVALDPSFEMDRRPRYRLQKQNAEAVIVFHTNVNGTGIYEAVGHADLYFNSQRMQPDCDTELCSHKKALVYFREARFKRMRRCNAIPESQDPECKRSQIFAFIPDESAFRCMLRGIYFVDTSEYPSANPT